MVQLSEGPVQRGNGKGGPTTPKPVILPKGQASARAALRAAAAHLPHYRASSHWLEGIAAELEDQP